MRKHLTPSLVISLIALFVALGGASYAAVKIPKNSVGTSQLKKNAVDSSKVRDRSLLAEDFKAGQLPRGEQGPRGETGARGETGSTGPAGPTYSFDHSEFIPAGGNPVTSGTDIVYRGVALPTSGRLIVNFTGRLELAGGLPGNASAQATCYAQVDPPNGGATPASQIIPSSPASYFTTGSTYQGGVISLSFGYDVAAAGLHIIIISCDKQDIVGSPTLLFDRYDLTGVLTGA